MAHRAKRQGGDRIAKRASATRWKPAGRRIIARSSGCRSERSLETETRICNCRSLLRAPRGRPAALKLAHAAARPSPEDPTTPRCRPSGRPHLVQTISSSFMTSWRTRYDVLSHRFGGCNSRSATPRLRIEKPAGAQTPISNLLAPISNLQSASRRDPQSPMSNAGPGLCVRKMRFSRARRSALTGK